MNEVSKVGRIYDERPAYRVLDVSGFFGPDDTLWPEGSEIFFDGEPAVEMEPLNEPARIKMTALLERLDELGRQAADKAGRPYAGRPRTLDGAITLATAVQRAEMSVMGSHQKDTSAIAPVEQEQAEVNIRKRGRPRKESLAKVANARV